MNRVWKWSVPLMLAPLVLVAPVSAVAGEASDATVPIVAARALGREDAVRLGEAAGPGVAVAAAPAAGIADATTASKAVLVTPPHLTLSVGERTGSVGKGFEIAATAIVDVPIRAIGAARADTARSLSSARDVDLRRARLDAGARAGVAWSRALEAKVVLHVRDESLGHADALAAYARRRVKAGPGQPIEVALAEGDLGSARSAHLEAEGWLVDADAELRLATGLAPTTVVDPVGDLCVTDDSVLEEDVAWTLAERDNPDLQVAAAGARLAGDDAKLAMASLAPFVGFGASFARDGFGDKVMTGIISIPLPFANPGKFEAGRARIAADVATAQVQRTKDEIRSAVHVAIHDREHSREVRSSLIKGALPPLREALRIARAQVDAGTQDVTLALLVRQRLLQAEEQYVHACGEVQRADLRFFRLLGRGGTP